MRDLPPKITLVMPSGRSAGTRSRLKTNEQTTKEMDSSDAPRRSKRQKVQQEDSEIFAPFKVPLAPATPKAKRTSKQSPVTTPKMANGNSLGESITTLSGKRLATPSRPTDPHMTNAILVTPGGTQAVAYPPDLLESSPSKQQHSSLGPGASNAGTLLAQACSHLVSIEPKLAPLIEKHTCHMFAPTGLAEKIEPFQNLASGIMAQQVSGAAANSIKKKFIGLFDGESSAGEKFPTPAQVAATNVERLRLAGLSQRKAEYIKGLAEKFESGELSTTLLLRASDDEVMEKLIAVRGLGKWSVEMFACFGLKRMDVFSTGDLGVQRGMAAFVGKDVKKLKAKGGGKWKYMSEQDMLEGSERFRPYRSLFMWYMWKVEDVDVSAVAG